MSETSHHVHHRGRAKTFASGREAKWRCGRRLQMDQLKSDRKRAIAADVGFDGWRRMAVRIDDTGVAYKCLRDAVSSGAASICDELTSIASAHSRGGLVSLRMRAAALLICDLVSIGYEVRSDSTWIYVRPPTAQAAGGPTKDAIRRNLEFGRNDQLSETATRRFILGLERPARGAGRSPITDLIADGRRLAGQLALAQEHERAERPGILIEICRPYLQLVEPGLRDEYTNLRLSDIWRYFRHMWATRYRSTPGRNLYYLVRDAAQASHPIIAIAALGNAVMQLRCRDDALGWTVDGLRRLIAEKTITDAEMLAAFKKRLLDDIGEIYAADFPAVDATNITDDVLDRLLNIERDATSQRAGGLRDDTYNGTRRIADIRVADLPALARSALFRSKRARALRELYRAYRALTTGSSLSHLVTLPDGEWALNQAIRQLKKQHAASSMMEITVCGAVPPYNQLLGGKLACFLMTSPRVAHDYESKYENGYSIIASQMAGRLVKKKPRLVFLSTASLYTERSSQYNRVRIPTGTLPLQSGEVYYSELGFTEGYGSLNLSTKTETALDALAAASRTYRNVNFVFGEGQSPKLRQLREGLDALGLSQTDLLNHGAPRVVYGVKLAKNVERYLLDIDDHVSYLVGNERDYASNYHDADESISAYWRSRWLASRIDYTPAMERVSRSTPLGERLSRLIPARNGMTKPGLFDTMPGEGEEPVREATREDEKTAFIRHLYRDQSAYSDTVKLSRLRELNVKTKVDDVVRRVVRAGGSIVITGNAGDGKTHILRLLEQELRSAKARYIIDASECTYEQVIDEWSSARHEGQPFCIAINEGFLIELIREYRSTLPWLDAVQAQLLNTTRLVQVDEVAEEGRFRPEKGETVVLDLSFRRTLAPSLAGAILDKLTEESWYTGCCRGDAQFVCPVRYNREMLRVPMVRDRMLALLNRVAERGVRVTFRELLAFVSYLIFGGKSCAELRALPEVEQTRYYWNAFEGQGLVFAELEAGLDPLRQTSPRIDEDLWRGRFSPEEFVGNHLAPIAARDLDELEMREGSRTDEAFVALKRRWYFEHAHGRLSFGGRADEFFADLQNRETAVQLRVGRLLALINKWWNRSDESLQERLRLWTRLSYSPRASGRAMVSGRDVANMRLSLFKPQLSAALQAAFGSQSVDYLILAPIEAQRYAGLLVDRGLVMSLISGGITERGERIGRQLGQFNDALAQYADVGSHVRPIELLDPTSDLSVKVRVDLSQRRYDSAV